MLFLATGVPFARRSLSSLARTVRFGAALVPALLLPLAAASAFPLTPSAGCTPSPYSSGDLTCINAGTITTSGADGLDAPAISGNATTINSGTVNSTGDVFGIRTITTLGDATTTNSGTVNVSGGPATGILTQGTGNATTNNSGAVNVSGTGNNIGINTSTGFAPVIEFGASLSAPSGPGTATTNNSGNVNVSGNFSTGILTAAGAASPGAFPAGIALAGGSTATTNNSGNVNIVGLGSVGIETTTQVFFTGPATIFSTVGGNATTTNTGNVSVNGTVDTNPSPPTQPGVVAFGVGGTFGILTAASFGNATTTNSGNVNVTGFSSTGISTTTNNGNATTINSGNITVVGTVGGTLQVCVNNCGGSNIGIATTTFNGNVTVINSGKISVTGPNNVGISMFASGTSTLVDSGTISAPGGIAILFANPTDPATLTLTQSSFTIGVINLIGAGDTVNVNAVNLNLTFNTLAGVNVAGNVPFVVSGNRIVSVDPTGFGVTDRTLMDFTRAVSGMLGGRASDAAASDAAGTGRALGFAGYDDSAWRFDDAFAQVMGYAKAPDNAMLFKNPTMTAPDGTTVWAKGFYGQRIQPADGPAFRNVSQLLWRRHRRRSAHPAGFAARRLRRRRHHQYLDRSEFWAAPRATSDSPVSMAARILAPRSSTSRCSAATPTTAPRATSTTISWPTGSRSRPRASAAGSSAPRSQRAIATTSRRAGP